MDKLNKKLQVLLSEDEVTTINRIILNEAIELGERPISISAFIRQIIRDEIDRKSDNLKEWKKDNLRKLKKK
jgi:Mg2+/Co2+ transporter CorB